MEQKKTKLADLERRRPTAFLLGLVVALSLCVAALELTTHPSTDSIDEELLDELAQDLESLPAMEQKDLLAAVDATEQQVVSQVVQEVQEASPVEPSAEHAASPTEQVLAPVEVPPSMVYDPSQVPAVPLDMNENPLKLRVVEDAPKPAMGWSAFMQWLTKTLKYPPTARKGKVQGTVLVNFVVNADGTVSDVRVVKGCDPALDREALRVARMMPAWEAGVRNGKPARTMVGIPVVFKL